MKSLKIKPGHETRYALILLIPGLIVLVGVVIFPFLYTVGLSFLRWNLRFAGAVPQFTWFSNYMKALTEDPRFYNSLNKTFYLMVIAVPLELLLGLGLALVFQGRFKGRRILFPIFLLPLAFSEAVIGLVWGLIFVLTYGPVDYLFQVLGVWKFLFGDRVDLLTFYPMECVIIADIWQWTPFFFLILLAALSSIPRDLVEAAMIDGASPYQVFRHVTLPMLKPAIGVAVIIRMIDVFKTFGVPYVMTKGGPGYASEVVSLYIFNQALQFLNVTYAAALTILVIIIIIILLNVFMRVYGIRFRVRGE